LAEQAGLSLRTLDRALWQYSKEHQKRTHAPPAHRRPSDELRSFRRKERLWTFRSIRLLELAHRAAVVDPDDPQVVACIRVMRMSRKSSWSSTSSWLVERAEVDRYRRESLGRRKPTGGLPSI
jgi:hypothetical protein